KLVTRNAVHFPRDIPQSEVDSADRGRAHDAVAMPKMLAIHHLPKMLNPRWILAGQQRRQILDTSDYAPGVPFQRRVSPAVKSGLIGEHFNENPIAHPRMADVGFDCGDFHDVFSTAFFGSPKSGNFTERLSSRID